MAFNFTDSWNPANDPKQSPWGNYAQRFAGDKYGNLAKDFNPGSDVTVGQGKGTQSGNDLTMIYNEPPQIMQGGENPWNKVLGAAASIGMGALSGGFGGGFGGGGGGAGAGNFSSAFSSSGPTFNPGVAFSGQSLL
jgi:hypothetical protein